jgi:F-type H+-transporting ATPase subunit b
MASLSFIAAKIIVSAADKEVAEGGGALPQLDFATWPGQIFWLAILFFIMYLLMDRVFLPKMGRIIEERNNRIADDYDQAAELKSQAEEAEKAYLQALADAKAKASAIAAETRASLDEEIAGMQAENDAKLATQIESAEARIAEMKTQAATKVREAAQETTKALVEALIEETPADDAVSSAVSGVAGS